MHGHFPSKLISQLGLTMFITEITVHSEKIHSFFALCTQQLLDHESYYLNITDANLTNKPKWQLEYTVKVGGDTRRLLPSLIPRLLLKNGERTWG